MESGFNAMGQTVPYFRRQAGYEQAKEMGVPSEEAFTMVDGMCVAIEKDEPFQAQKVASKYLDGTGFYRLLAYLLTAEEPKTLKTT